MNNTPDTTFYLWLWVGIFIVIASIYLGSLWLRFRDVQRDTELLQELSRDRTDTP